MQKFLCRNCFARLLYIAERSAAESRADRELVLGEFFLDPDVVEHGGDPLRQGIVAPLFIWCYVHGDSMAERPGVFGQL
uniref:Uncharacterized protein n=1 Tax=mine drainage metagenome TaxID=410659 RepID=E6Q865_9ZZZZ